MSPSPLQTWGGSLLRHPPLRRGSVTPRVLLCRGHGGHESRKETRSFEGVLTGHCLLGRRGADPGTPGGAGGPAGGRAASWSFQGGRASLGRQNERTSPLRPAPAPSQSLWGDWLVLSLESSAGGTNGFSFSFPLFPYLSPPPTSCPSNQPRLSVRPFICPLLSSSSIPLSIYPSVCSPVLLPIYPPLHLSIHSSICSSVYLSVHPCPHPHITRRTSLRYLSSHPSVRSSNHPSFIPLSTHPPVHSFTCQFTHPLTRPSVRPPICPSVLHPASVPSSSLPLHHVTGTSVGVNGVL